MRAGRGALPFIFVTAMLNSMGIGLIMPVMPALLEELGGGGLAEAAALSLPIGVVRNRWRARRPPWVRTRPPARAATGWSDQPEQLHAPGSNPEREDMDRARS